MGNIMLCGSLCDSCEASNATQVNQNDNKNDDQKNNNQQLDQILIKEIFEREKIERIIDKEINLLKNIINTNDSNINEKCEQAKKNIYINIAKLEKDSHKSINKIEHHIEKIKDNHLFHIEKDIGIIKTKIDNTNENIDEMKNLLKEINNATIKNSTTLDLLKA